MLKAEKFAQVVSRTLLKWSGCNYYPPAAEDWSRVDCVVLGTKSNTIGDALMLTTLPQKLKQRYPSMQIKYLPRGFNAVVMANNPAVKGPSFFTRVVFGDDANWGEGHLIQVKERFFGLEPSQPASAQIFLSKLEQEWARKFLGPNSLPLVAVHPWGATQSKVGTQEWWDATLSPFKKDYDFVQLGVEGQPLLASCKLHLLLNKQDPWEARKLFAMMESVAAFIGVDSGPMHVARAFRKPGLIVLNHTQELDKAFKERLRVPLALNHRHDEGFLYSENQYYFLDRDDAGLVSDFLKKR